MVHLKGSVQWSKNFLRICSIITPDVDAGIHFSLFRFRYERQPFRTVFSSSMDHSSVLLKTTARPCVNTSENHSLWLLEASIDSIPVIRRLINCKIMLLFMRLVKLKNLKLDCPLYAPFCHLPT